MENIDIKNFTTVSSVSDEDNILLSRGSASGAHGKIPFALFQSSVSKKISPSIVNGIWHIGGSSTGIPAKGEDGKTPVFSEGTVTTGLPDTQVSARVRYDGINADGNPMYVIDFTIPAGKPGKDGNGAGNVYVETGGLESGKLYLFQPGADGSANGTMVEFARRLSMEIESSKGYEFYHGELDTVLTAHVYLGGEDISGSVASSYVKWTRDSGDTGSDTAWNTVHGTYGLTLPLTEKDVPPIRPDYIVFTCEAEVDSQGEKVKLTNKIII